MYLYQNTGFRDRGPPILVQGHIGFHGLKHFFFLLRIQQIFHFISFKTFWIGINNSPCTFGVSIVQRED